MIQKKIDWTASFFIIGYHLFFFIAAPIALFTCAPAASMLWISLALVFVTGISVTALYHRLYSHLCYKTNPIVEAIFLFFASAATQGSALRWAYDHRLHHAFVDTEKDPYSIKKGFWHAHVLWMFFHIDEIDPKVVSDLLRNKLLVLQHKYYGLCMVISNTAIFLTLGWAFQDYWNAFVFGWLGRTFLLHHTTWFINSLAHTWGSRHYSEEHSAADNYFLCLLTYGEGYHNYHHTFAQDYRNGIRWYHFDPTKWLIWTLYKLGLARDLKRVNDFRIAKQLISFHKEKLISYLQGSLNLGIEKKVVEIGDLLIDRLGQLQALYEKCRAIPKAEAKLLQEQIKAYRKEWKTNWKSWKKLIRVVNLLGLHDQPSPAQ